MKQIEVGTEVVIASNNWCRPQAFKQIVSSIKRDPKDIYNLYGIKNWDNGEFPQGSLGFYFKSGNFEFGVFMNECLTQLTDDKYILEAVIETKGKFKYITEVVVLDPVTNKVSIPEGEEMNNIEYYEDIQYLFEVKKDELPIKAVIDAMMEVYNG